MNPPLGLNTTVKYFGSARLTVFGSTLTRGPYLPCKLCNTGWIAPK